MLRLSSQLKLKKVNNTQSNTHYHHLSVINGYSLRLLIRKKTLLMVSGLKLKKVNQYQ